MMAAHAHEPQQCPVCGAENDLLALTCASCGSYMRDRVAGLNLFETVWALVETPAETFIRIARSEQRNYALTLFVCIGPLILAGMYAVARAGDTRLHFGLLLLALFTIGPALGLLCLPLAVVLLRAGLRVVARVTRSVREISVLTAYALFPLAVASLVVFPIQIGIWGSWLFMADPAPWEIKPLEFAVTGGLEALALLWSFTLLARAFRIYRVTARQSLIALIPPILLLGAIVWLGGVGLGRILP